MTNPTTSQQTGILTNDGLRRALERIRAGEGWHGPTGQSVVDALRTVARRWISQHTDVDDMHRTEHLVGLAWELLATHADAVIEARSPWGMVHVSMWHRACATVLADELGVSERHARHLLDADVRAKLGEAMLHTTVRVADGNGWSHVRTAIPDADRPDPIGDDAVARVEPDPMADWDDALRLLCEELVTAGAPENETVEAILGVVEAIATAESRSRMHTAVYRSPWLSGLDHAQRRALVELLIGTRRGGAAESAWLALRQALAAGEPASVHTHSRFAARARRFAAPFRTSPDGRGELAMSA